MCGVGGPFRAEHAEDLGGECVIWMVHLGQNMLKAQEVCVCDMDGPFRAEHAEVTYSLH